MSMRKPTAVVPLVLLVCGAQLINYVDRGNLATAVPLLQGELHLTGTQVGVLLSAFYYSYVVAMVPVGALAQRLGAQRVLAAGIAIWSLATLLTGFATGFVTLLLLRLLLGIGESASFPCSSQLFASRLTLRQISTATGFMSFSYLVGPAVGTLLGGLLMPHFGWRAVFVMFGAVSLLWVWPLMRIRLPQAGPPGTAAAPAGTAAAPPTGPTGPSFARILRERGLWGASLGHFAGNYNYYLILSWLPAFLVNERGLSMQRMAVVAGSAYLLNALSAVAAGWLAARRSGPGRSPSGFYKGMMAVNHVVSLVCMVGLVVLPLGACLACLVLLQVVTGLSSPGYFAIPQIMAGPTATSRWVGVQNACGNVAGLTAPLLTGLLLDATGHFAAGFVLAGAINVLGLIGWLWILPRIQPIDWSRPAGVSSPSRVVGEPL
ncbi:MAG: MFS transporter [Proteobacteria bacterium]|nr:MFS transporter [Pseudomonadota bacterium]